VEDHDLHKTDQESFKKYKVAIELLEIGSEVKQ